MKEIRDAEGNFRGFRVEVIDDHRSRGITDGAWCWACGKGCRPDRPCTCCENESLQAENERLRKTLEEIITLGLFSKALPSETAQKLGEITKRMAREALEEKG